MNPIDLALSTNPIPLAAKPESVGGRVRPEVVRPQERGAPFGGRRGPEPEPLPRAGPDDRSRATAGTPNRPVENTSQTRGRRTLTDAEIESRPEPRTTTLGSLRGTAASSTPATLFSAQQIAQEVLLLQTRPSSVDVDAANRAFRRLQAIGEPAQGLQRAIDLNV